MKPRVRRADGLLHLRYSLPNHTYCSAVYPRSAPNGSEVIVCGHEQGLSIIWRGGRRLKAGSDRSATSDSDAEMEDDGEEGDAEYEPEEDEVDAAHPYRPIIQHVEIPLGTAVLHMAFPYLRQSQYEDFVVQPLLLQEELVVGLACEDRTIRVLTLPLAPPSNSEKAAQDKLLGQTGSNGWRDGVITVSKDDHRSVPRGVSVAFALHKDAAPDPDDEDEEGQPDLEDLWDLVVVSHSAHVTGIFHIHRVPVSEDGRYLDPSASDSMYWQTERLSSPADVVRVTVPLNPGSLTWPRVLVSADGCPIRVFECCTESDPDHGQWTAAIYPGFEPKEGSGHRQRRVLDAQWAMAGSSIVALLTSGEWRMYDVGLRKGQKTISASVPTKCALSGWVDKAAASQPAAAAGAPEPRQKLTPMTPSTRKVRSEAFLSGQQPGAPQTHSQGGVCVIPTKKAASNGFVDEMIVAWCGASGVVIPSFAAFYRGRKDAADPFAGGVAGQARDLPRTDLHAEIRSGVSVFAAQGRSSRLQAAHPDVLLCGERSLVIVASPLPQSARAARAPRRPPAVTDDTLLAAGDLDVGGLDRMLDSMADGRGSPSPAAKKRVGSLR